MLRVPLLLMKPSKMKLNIKSFFSNYVCITSLPGIDPPDAEKEKTGILALQIKERDVPHSVRAHSNILLL